APGAAKARRSSRVATRWTVPAISCGPPWWPATGKDLTLVREEVFGPVVVAMPFDDPEAVLAEANRSEYGLGASIWSNDLRAVQRLVDGLDAGTVWVNTHNIVDPNMPFGGYKAS